LDALYTYQNMGIGSQTSTMVAARFTADVVNLKPKIALIQGAVNDISGGLITEATFLSNYTTMLDACVTASIVPVICKMIPWTNGTNANMQTCDTWMASLQALVATYSSAVWVDFTTELGQFRVGGDVGNLWDLKAAYAADGVHPNLAGYTKMAELIDNAIKAKYVLV
jgi:lysophospholipase L1-like esterase